MSSNNKNKNLVIDERVLDLIFNKVGEYEEFLAGPQQKAQFRRHLKMYRDEIRAGAKEADNSNANLDVITADGE